MKIIATLVFGGEMDRIITLSIPKFVVRFWNQSWLSSQKLIDLVKMPAELGFQSSSQIIIQLNWDFSNA
jgi:hypothetical protein